MNRTTILAFGVIGILLAGCAITESAEEKRAKAVAMMKASFKERGQAKLDRFDQDPLQRACSLKAGEQLDKAVAARLEKEQQALIKYPSDGNYLGDFRNGERIAQSGVGGQYSDDPSRPAGGNCYACHQLSKAEVSYGTIGPSLYNFGKIRGYTPEVQKYAFGKVYNSQAFAACSSMPRFGHNKVLTEAQIKDLVALLMDPKSPINQ